MKTTIVKYEVPLSLPFGGKEKLAQVLGVHPNTIYRIRTQGKSHPLYGKLTKALEENYGKPVEVRES